MSNIFEIGLYELSDYIFAYDILPGLKAEKEEVIESLYDDCTASTVQRNELGQLVHVSVNVEDMAIYIIQRKAEYDKMINRYEGKAKLFEEAMESLTDRERDVIQVKYFHRGNDLNLTPNYFHRVLQEAQQKLCDSICQLNQKKFKLIKLQEKEDKLQRAREWKQAN